MLQRQGGLEGRVVVVTGAGRGIGQGIAERFGREGASVVVSARRLEACDAVAAAIRAAGGQAVGVQADVSVADDVDALVAQTVDTYGRLDVLVNNAAIAGQRAHVFEHADDELDRYLQTNVAGAFRCAKRAARVMARNGRGVIISISSIVGIRGIRRMVAYTTSKAAIDGMTRALALDLAPYGVRVNAVAPGIVWSPERWASAVPADRETRERAIPLQRIGLPEDVAAACAFLASDDGSYITGQVLYVDGGLSVQARTMHDDPNGFDPSRIAP